MENQKNYMIAKNINDEGYVILQVFRSLTNEEQRIVCAVLDGMKLQQQLDSQCNEEPV